MFIVKKGQQRRYKSTRMPASAATRQKSSTERGPRASTAVRQAFSSPIIFPKSVRTAPRSVHTASMCRKHRQNTCSRKVTNT